MKTKKFSAFRVVKIVDEDSIAHGWDGDEPLDPSREWTPYILDLQGECVGCGEWTTISNICGTWVTDDASGERHIRDSIADYLLPYIEGQRKPGKRTIPIVENV
jgi:hypothetical protein